MIKLNAYSSLQVCGYSRAAHRTGIEIKGLDILLDAGLDVQKSFANIFITHQHLDHCIFLPQYTMNIDKKEEGITVVSAENILKNIKPYLCEALRMSKNISLEISHDDILKYASTKFTPITPEQLYTFNNGREQWLVKAIKCFHGIDSIGFGFSVKKNKLKEQYLQLSGREIKMLKDLHIEITEEIIAPIFLFLGDTNKKILENEEIYEYKTIIVECTYIYDDEIDLAKTNKHMHWLEIKDYIKKYKTIQFILIHFSMKYKKDEIIKFFQEQKTLNKISNIDCLI
jgi:ribonuclease Z